MSIFGLEVRAIAVRKHSLSNRRYQKYDEDDDEGDEEDTSNDWHHDDDQLHLGEPCYDIQDQIMGKSMDCQLINPEPVQRG